MKRKTRLLIAGLMAIAVTGASTLAYFTSGVDLNNGSSKILKLDITNGIVKITEGNGKGLSPKWTYDLAEVDAYTNTDENNKHRSPDITGFLPADYDNVLIGGSTVRRLKVGAVLQESGGTGKAVITNARPGDALSLRSVAADDINYEDGLVIKNESNLTIKCDIRISATNIDSSNEIKKLMDAGWELLINGVKVNDFSDLKVRLTSLSQSITTDLNGGGKSTTIKIKLQLPRATTNTAQGNDTGNISAFSFGDLFEIVATQENNPGFKVDGSN